MRVAVFLALLAQAGLLLRGSGHIGLCAAAGDLTPQVELLAWCEEDAEGVPAVATGGGGGLPTLEPGSGCSHQRLSSQAQHRGPRPAPPPAALPAPGGPEPGSRPAWASVGRSWAGARAASAPGWVPLRL